MGKPMFCSRADKEYKYEKYYNIVFTWDIVSNPEINRWAFQFMDSFFKYSLRTSRILQISLLVKDGYIGIEMVLLQTLSVFGNPLT